MVLIYLFQDMRGSRNFIQKVFSEGVKLWLRFFLSWCHYKRAIIAPPAERHLNSWRDDGGPSLNADLVALWFYRGSRPVLLRYPIFFLWFCKTHFMLVLGGHTFSEFACSALNCSYMPTVSASRRNSPTASFGALWIKNLHWSKPNKVKLHYTMLGLKHSRITKTQVRRRSQGIQ